MDESKFYAYCLQGDVTAAYDYLHSIPDKSNKYQDFEAMYYNRFFSEKPTYSFKSKDPWIRKVLLAYYQYFTSVLTGRNGAKAENQLAISLAALIPDSASLINLDRLEDRLEGLFNEKGYHFLGGVTVPFRGPYIWKTTEKKEFIVELPHQIQKVTVYFLSDFVLQSWLHFATFGEKFAGGWAKPEGLYFVNDRPKKPLDFKSSEFQISYLKHETQHLNDYARFPNLPSKDLEYRAKLVELIYEPQSMRLLEKFFYESKNDPALPHSYSSYAIMRRLSRLAFGKEEIIEMEMWKTVSTKSIREWAWILYDEHTKKLGVNEGTVRGI